MSIPLIVIDNNPVCGCGSGQLQMDCGCKQQAQTELPVQTLPEPTIPCNDEGCEDALGSNCIILAVNIPSLNIVKGDTLTKLLLTMFADANTDDPTP